MSTCSPGRRRAAEGRAPVRPQRLPGSSNPMKRIGILTADGTLNGMQALSRYLPTALAPKTIDNDLGLNYRHEVDEWLRQPCPEPPGYRYARGPSRTRFDLEQMVNYVTPGYATAVFVSAWG